MAAANYYNPGGQPQQQPSTRPPPTQQNAAASSQSHLNPNPPYPVFDGPPPPYTAYAEPPRPHSQPPPQQRPPVNDQYRAPQPSNLQTTTHAYPPEKLPLPRAPVQNMYKASDFGGPYTPQPPPPQQQSQPHQPPYLHPQQQPQGYFPLAGTPAMAQVYGNGSVSGPSTTPGYRPPQSPYRDDYKRNDSAARSRSRSRSRHRKHHHHRERPQQLAPPTKKSSGVNTFLGAGGGALIGDAIFPGLGTLSGAILGGLGGHEYTKRRASSNPNRTRARSYSNDFDYGDYQRGRKY